MLTVWLIFLLLLLLLLIYLFFAIINDSKPFTRVDIAINL